MSFSKAEQETIIRIPREGDEFYIYTNYPKHYNLCKQRVGEAILAEKAQVVPCKKIAWDLTIPKAYLNKTHLGLKTLPMVNRAKELAENMKGVKIGSDGEVS